jgi:RHS repeat-associated protein
VAVEGGAGHSLAVKGDGSVRSWGSNWFGQLGDGTTIGRTTPVMVSSLSGAIAVASGTWHSLALKDDGTARAWGYNYYGQLGDGTTVNSSVPVTVSNLSGGTAVAAGGHHSLALPIDGTARAWGYNVLGQLGDGTRTNRTSPVQPQLSATKYYYFGGQRVAMWRNGVLQYIAGDHLGSTSLVLNDDGTVHSEARYYPYGEERWRSGTLPTEYRFTGQRSETGLGLYQMGARFYDAALGRWISADTLVPEPGNPQSYNRYSYTRNNPVKFRDPSGHLAEGEYDEGDLDLTLELLILDEEDLYWYLHNTNSEFEILAFAAGGLVLLAAPSAIPALVDAVATIGPEVVAARFGKAILEESAESAMTGRPFDPVNVGLDVVTEFGDDFIAAGRGGRRGPNPGGRLGGPQHRAVSAQVVEDVEARGLQPYTEFYVRTPGGRKGARFVDVAALDVDRNPVEFHQVGRITQGGLPVARERYAISDIFEFGGYDVPIHFHPYY